MPVSAAARAVRIMLSPSSIARKAGRDVTEQVKKLKEPPASLAEYVDGGSHYIAKRLMYLLILAVLLAPALFLNFCFPLLQSRFLTKTMPIDSAAAAEYTGKVRLTDRESGMVLFEGTLDKGRVNGFGRLYGYEGEKRYEGNFLMEVFDGYGETYFPGGSLKYRGNFSMNRQEGEGILYYPQGTVCYEGGFAAGEYEGSGVLYEENGKKQYEGQFVKGLYEGMGILYGSQGEKQYEGSFEA